MQLPFRKYYTVKPALLFGQYGREENIPDTAINFNIILDDEKLFTPALFKEISSIQNNCIFSLSFALVKDKARLEHILPKLYLLASLFPSSKKTGLIIPVFFNGPAEYENIDVAIIKSYFHSQGIEKISIPLFNLKDGKNSIQNSEDYSFLIYATGDNHSLHHFLTATSSADKFTGPLIIGFRDDIPHTSCLHKIIKEISVIEKNNLSESLIDNCAHFFIEREVFEEETERWKLRAELYKNFLSLSKKVQQKEYYDVLDWYHNEYEILPTWYKRFGHIVKVLMGKRTFRSLFSDTVKKYKN